MSVSGGRPRHFALARLMAESHPTVTKIIEQFVVRNIIASGVDHEASGRYCGAPAAEPLLKCNDSIFALTLICTLRERATLANHCANPPEIIQQIGV